MAQDERSRVVVFIERCAVETPSFSAGVAHLNSHISLGAHFERFMLKKSNFTKRELGRFRKIFFPLIAKGVITGYNHYPRIFKRKANFLVNYLHTNLGKHPDGRDEEHKSELIEKIRGSGLAHLVTNINKSLSGRIALYELELDWLTKDLKIYDENGRPLKLEEAQLYTGVIIGEGKQYDLAIEINREKDLKCVLDLFGRIINKYKIDNSGNWVQIDGENIENTEAIKGSWKIPIVLVSTKHTVQYDSYKKIKKIAIKKNYSEISTLVDRSEPIIREKLEKEKTKYITKELLANRLCYNWINKK